MVFIKCTYFLYRLLKRASRVHKALSEWCLAHFTESIPLSVKESTDWTRLLTWNRPWHIVNIGLDKRIVFIWLWRIIDAIVANADVAGLLIRRRVIAHCISPLVLNILGHDAKVLILSTAGVCSFLSVWNVSLRCEWVHLEGVVSIVLLSDFDL